MNRRRGILAAGNWIVDRVKQIDRWPGEGNLCNILRERRAAGGGPCNVLFDLAALDPGLPLYAAGRVGEDEDGELLLAEIHRRGIDGSFMRRSATAPTSYSEVMSGGGKRTFFHCRGANAELEADELAAIDVPARFFYLGYLLLLDRLDAADPEYGTRAARLLAEMRARGYQTVADFVSEAPKKFRKTVLPALPHIDILIINEIEAGCCLGESVREDDGTLIPPQLRRAAECLIAGGVNRLAVIHFPEGAVALSREGEYCQAASCRIDPADIAGTNGAGDAFAAGVIYALHEGMPLEKALRVGNASGYFNLLSATANEGAVGMEKINRKLEPEIPAAKSAQTGLRN